MVGTGFLRDIKKILAEAGKEASIRQDKMRRPVIA
jgi:hypothetical protein